GTSLGCGQDGRAAPGCAAVSGDGRGRVVGGERWLPRRALSSGAWVGRVAGAAYRAAAGRKWTSIGARDELFSAWTTAAGGSADKRPSTATGATGARSLAEKS